MDTEKDNKIVIFKNEAGNIEIDVQLKDETVWLSLNQLVELFGRDKSVISRHLINILKEGELDPKETVAKLATVQTEGNKTVKRQIDYYNLDMIISVGYRVNSKSGIEFRKWANKILKNYLIKGYSINQKKVLDDELKELKQVVGLLSTTLINQGLVNSAGQEVLNLIKSYAKTWEVLLKYDEESLELPKVKQSSIVIEYQKVKEVINSLRQELVLKNEASEFFGKELDNALKGIIGNLYQTFGGEELYPAITEKAAHLIYFVIKDHPFVDGNKRIGCLLFLYFMQINKLSLKSMTSEGLTALALLIAESSPAAKELIIKLIVNLINDDGAINLIIDGEYT